MCELRHMRDLYITILRETKAKHTLITSHVPHPLWSGSLFCLSVVVQIDVGHLIFFVGKVLNIFPCGTPYVLN